MGTYLPLYEYQCKAHGHRFEVRQGINEDPVQVCPECGAEVRRVIHPVGIVFKGSGFYVTDSRGAKSAVKSGESPEKSGDAAKQTSEKSAGSADGTAKTESKAEGKSDAKSNSTSGQAGESAAS